MLYAQAVNETLARGGSLANSTAITLQMRNRTFYGQFPCRLWIYFYKAGGGWDFR